MRSRASFSRTYSRPPRSDNGLELTGRLGQPWFNAEIPSLVHPLRPVLAARPFGPLSLPARLAPAHPLSDRRDRGRRHARASPRADLPPGAVAPAAREVVM